MFKLGDKQLISTHRPMGPFCGCIHILETVSIRGSGCNEKRSTGCLGYMSGMKYYPVMWGFFHKPLLSNEKNPGCLGYIRDYTTQLCGDF